MSVQARTRLVSWTVLVVFLLFAGAYLAIPNVRAAQSSQLDLSCYVKSVAYTASTTCKAAVIGTATPSGTVTFVTSGLGTFVHPGSSCTLSSGTCSVSYTEDVHNCVLICFAPSVNDTITASYSGDANNLASTNSTTVVFHSCWFDECLVNSSPYSTSYDDWFCVIGNTPHDTLGDCKLAVQDFTDSPTGVDLSNQGITVPGAGMFAVAAGIIPGVGQAALTAAIAYAASVGETISAGAVATLVADSAIGAANFGGMGAYCAFATKGCPDVVTVEALATASVAVPGVGAFYVSSVAVALTIACGGVGSACYGANITGTMLTNQDQIQTKPIPIAGLSQLWGGPKDGIGWSVVKCTILDGVDKCPTPDQCKANPTFSACPVPGSASPDNSHLSNTGAPVKCATGRILGLSIGYDGDVSFDVNVNGTSSFGLVNRFNFLPGSGGTAAPGGIDIEIPPSDRSTFPMLKDLRTGMGVHVCGQWVTDMHDFWNELHPVTSLSVVPDFTISAQPSDATVLAGEQASFTTTVTLKTGPTGDTPITLAVVSGLPAGATASFLTNPVPLNNPNTMTGTSSLQISTSTTGGLGDYSLDIQGKDQSGLAVKDTNVNLHVFDFALDTGSTPVFLLPGKSNSFIVSPTLTGGSSTTGLPTVTLSTAGTPSGTSSSYSPSATGVPTFTSTLTLSSTTAAPNGTYTIGITGTVANNGGSRSTTRQLIVLPPVQTITSNTVFTSDVHAQIFVGANNLVLNCNGHQIVGVTTLDASPFPNYGIFLNHTRGIVVKDCVVKNFFVGFRLVSANFTLLAKDNATIDGYGFWLTRSSFNILTRDLANGNNVDGFKLDASSNLNSLVLDKANSNGGNGFTIASSRFDSVSYDSASNNLGNGYSIISVTYSGFASDNATSNGVNGFYLSSVMNSFFTGDRANGNQLNGFDVIGSSGNNFAYDIANNNGASGFLLSASSRNMLSHNVAKGNAKYGFALTSSSNNNMLSRNIGLDNLLYDAYQDSTSVGNSYEDNFFRTTLGLPPHD